MVYILFTTSIDGYYDYLLFTMFFSFPDILKNLSFFRRTTFFNHLQINYRSVDSIWNSPFIQNLYFCNFLVR